VAPNSFSPQAVNAQIARIGLRAPLPAFAGPNVGSKLTLYTGQPGDEGWFAPKTIPTTWAAAGPTTNGISNFLLAGPGLGSGRNPEALLDKVPDLTPLRAAGLGLLAGKRICAVVYKSDVSVNYGPLNGSLKGANLGKVALEVLTVTARAGTLLPALEVRVLDSEAVCGEELALLSEAPEPSPILPPATLTDSFKAVGQFEVHSIPITANIETVEIKIKWKNKGDRFSVRKVTILSGRKVIARGLSMVAQRRPKKLKISSKRTPTSTTVRISNLAPGKLKFSVTADKLRTTGRTSVTTQIRRILK
jgi:hypothetical protein